MTTRLFLIRHGQTQANIEQRYQGQGNTDLSELGINEAEKLSNALANEEFSAVYSSTLSRSNKTASIIAKNHSKEVIAIQELIERDYGDWEDLKFDEIKNKYGEKYDHWLENPAKTIIPKAETLEDLQKRGVKAIEKLIKKHKGQSICVVGHGGINRTILFNYLGIDLNNFWRIKQNNCCVNIIEFDKIPRVVLLNSTWFIDEKHLTGSKVY